VTAGTRDYPDILAETMESRQTQALERIATALEQLVLAGIPSEHAAFNAAKHDLEPSELPPPPQVAPYTVAAAQPYQAPVAVTTISSPAPWVCPVHHEVKVVPAGVSKSSGKPYNSFLSCTDRECKHVADRCRVPGCRDPA
jgi:hypothetical protein